jgi:hypothetical protein
MHVPPRTLQKSRFAATHFLPHLNGRNCRLSFTACAACTFQLLCAKKTIIVVLQLIVGFNMM